MTVAGAQGRFVKRLVMEDYLRDYAEAHAGWEQTSLADFEPEPCSFCGGTGSVQTSMEWGTVEACPECIAGTLSPEQVRSKNEPWQPQYDDEGSVWQFVRDREAWIRRGWLKHKTRRR